MKPIVALLLLFSPFVALAQQGSVLYEERVTFDIELPPEMEAMRDRIPSENITATRLYFDGATSLMKTKPAAEEEQQLEAESRGFRMRMRAAQADAETYTDHDRHLQVERRDFLGRTFLITSEPASLAWRLTDERAEFLGFASQKAVATTEDGTRIEAWFTPEIFAPVGPSRYGGLPGLILVLTEDDGRRSFVAKEVSLEPQADVAIAAPTRGREVTREEFQALVEERMREMGMEGGRRGGAVMFRRGN